MISRSNQKCIALTSHVCQRSTRNYLPSWSCGGIPGDLQRMSCCEIKVTHKSIKNQSNPSTKKKIDGNHMRLVEAALDGPHPREPLLEHKFHLRHRTNRSHQESAVRSLHLFYQIDHHVTMCSQCEVMFEIVGCTRAIGTHG